MRLKLKEIGWVIACFLLAPSIQAQVLDDFSDGDFTTNPPWTGESTRFEVAVGQLHLNDVAAGEAYLSTPSEAIANAEWNFYVEISENPSSTNFTSIYLVSDQADLSGELNGYLVKIGGTNDEVSLYRQDGSAQAVIIDGVDGRVDVKPVQIEVKVTRDASGNWELSSQPLGDVSFSSEGSVQDDTYQLSNYFGVYCKYTSTRKDAFYFDDITISGTPQPDTQSPVVSTLSIQSSTQLTLRFSEPVSSATGETVTNYSLLDHSVTSASATSNEVALTIEPALANADDYTLSVRNIQDEAGNVLSDTILSFFYLEPVPAQWNDVIISELMPDPNPVKDNLPDAEFVEIYNRSQNLFDLQNWSLNSKRLPSYILHPQQFIILCAQADSTSFAPFGSVVALESWPTLSNGGSQLTLQDATSTVIDSIKYSASEVVGGTSLERISEEPPCDQRTNLALSLAERGGTPGMVNTVSSTEVDTTAPQIQEIRALDNTLQLIFDERVSDAELRAEAIQIEPELTVTQVVRDTADEKVLWVHLASELVTNTSYSLTFLDAQDCYGNTEPSQTASFHFDNEPPSFLRVLVRDTAEVELFFSEKLAGEVAKEEDYYWLDSIANTPKSAGIGEDSTSVVLEFPISIADEQVHQLTITQWEDIYGNPGDTLTVDLHYQQNIDTVIIKSEYHLEAHLSESILLEPISKLSNYRIDREVGNPQAVFTDRGRPTVIHLIFANPFSANREHELLIEELMNEKQELLNTPIYRFYFDQSAPQLDSVRAVGERTLLAYFDEQLDSLSATNLLHYQLASLAPKVTEADLLFNRQTVQLHLDSALFPETDYELEVLGVADLAGNSISSTKTRSFVYDQHPPKLLSGKIISPYEVRLYFSEDVAPSDPDSYHLDPLGSPDSVWTSQIQTNEVRLLFSKPVPPGEAILTVTDAADLRGNTLPEPIQVVIDNTKAALGYISVLSSTELRLGFTHSIDKDAMLDPAKYLVNKTHLPTDVVIVDGQPYAVQLIFETSFQPESNYTLSVDELVSTGGQVASEVHDSFIYRTQVESIDTEEQALLLHFRVPLDSSQAVQLKHYQLAGEHPLAVLRVDDQTVRLVFQSALEPLTRYELKLAGLTNIDGDIIPESIHTVGLGRSPDFNELLITEIMADPTPSVGLPEAEYLELYNVTDDLISTAGLRLSDGNAAAVLPSVLLLPGEYVIVSASADHSKLVSYGRVVGVANFPSLNSDGDDLSLADSYGREIFSVSYSNTWYNDAEKKRGGWSLEMIDHNQPCGEQNNWTSSVAALGGTPGQDNSVKQSNSDNKPPYLQEAFAESATELTLKFSEKLDPSSLAAGQIHLSDNITTDTITWHPSRKSASVKLANSLRTKVTYTVKADQLYDCSGNEIDDSSVLVTLSEEAVSGDMLLSEILFHPRSGGVRFVEIFNFSDKPVNLKDWQLANKEGDSLVNRTLVTDENYQIVSNQYLALTEDATTLIGDYPSASQGNTLVVANFPSFPSSAGNIVLLSPAGEEMQYLEYDDQWHHPIVENTRGVSLERIRWSAPVNDRNNWQSAAQTAGFATPGYANSQAAASNSLLTTISVDPPVFTPDQDGFDDYTQIQYRWPNAGNVANVIIFDSQGHKVRHLARNTTLAEEGFLRWDGTDDAQQSLPMGYYLIYFEVFHTNGQVSVLKERVALGRPF